MAALLIGASDTEAITHESFHRPALQVRSRPGRFPRISWRI